MATSSDCRTAFGADDLEPSRPHNQCPAKGCSATLSSAPSQWGDMPFCSEHGIRVHWSSPTFVYYNGDDAAAKRVASLRNIRVESDFFATNIFNNPNKAESHRFASENSEDALTWNVFVGILARRQLHKLYEWFTGEAAPFDTVKLYLWGLRVEPEMSGAPPYEHLDSVRRALEPDITRYRTEPDAMIIGPRRLLCIEAKFTSGNPLAHDVDVEAGEKPKRREELIDRYVERNHVWATPAIAPRDIGSTVHSQLLRAAVFAACMAQLAGTEWQVVNLVSATQWESRRRRRVPRHEDLSDPTPSLSSPLRAHFRFDTWEALYEGVVRDDPALADVGDYMRRKSAFLRRAFQLA